MTRQNLPVSSKPRRSHRSAVRPFLGLGFAACAIVTACSGTPPAPKAVINATLGRSPDPVTNNNLCNLTSTTSVLQIGTFTGTDPTRVSDGQTQMGANVVHVRCGVGGGYDLDLEATLAGVRGGSILIKGHVDGMSGGTGIHAVLNAPQYGGGFVEENCTIAFTYNGGPVPQPTPVAAGRVWAHLSCPAMRNTNGMQVKIMGTTSVDEMCAGEADFLFENCS